MKCQVEWITSWNQDCQVKYQQSQICRWYHSDGRNRWGDGAGSGQTINKVTDFIFLGSKITEDGDCSHEIKRPFLLGRKTITNLDSMLKGRDIILLTKVHYSQSYGFPSSQVQVWELDLKEGWEPKNLCFCTMVLEKSLESPLDCKEIQPINPKGNQPWIFTGRTDAEAEAPILWPPDAKSRLTVKTLILGKNEGRRGRGPQRIRWLGGVVSSVDVNLSWLRGRVEDRAASCAAIQEVTKSRRQRSAWTTPKRTNGRRWRGTKNL